MLLILLNNEKERWIRFSILLLEFINRTTIDNTKYKIRIL